MDPNPVWNRIEQLERLVVSQANEIEILKRSIQRINAQQSLVELQRNDDDVPTHRYSRAARYSSRTDRRDYNIRAPPDVNFYSHRPTTYAAHSYQMNSFVHPPSAIPPRGSARWQQPYQETLRLANGRPTATLRSPPRTPPIQSPHLSPLPNKQRWSAAPNLGLASNDDEEIGELGGFNDLDESEVHPKHSRQSFVEPSIVVVASKKGPLALEDAPRLPPESDDEEIDVEKVDVESIDVEKLTDSSGEHVGINVVSDIVPPVAPPCPPPSTSTAVALLENQQEIIRIQSDSSDSEVEEIGRIAPKPRKVLVERRPKVKVVAKIPHKKKRWSLVKIEPCANNSGGSGDDYQRPYVRPTHTTSKTGLKTVPKKVRSRSKSPEVQDQSWIWSRDPSQRLSLPTDLKDIIRNSPF